MIGLGKKRQFLAAWLLASTIVWIANTVLAQSGEVYKARLTTVPVDAGMLRTVAGSGSVTAVLSGTKLIISGKFAGLKSPATYAHIHHGMKAIRGPAVLDLPVPSATSGTISASVYLTSEEVRDLQNNSLYIQINSQGAPAGNLWGWLLPATR